MLKSIRFFLPVIIAFFCTSCLYLGNRRISLLSSESLIVNHTCTDLSKIPNEWVEAVKENIKCYYAHTSHGVQLTAGLREIAESNSKYAVLIQKKLLPGHAGAVAILDDPYAGPGDYWQTKRGRERTESIIDYFPINMAMWSWCGQAGSYSAEQVQEYLDALDDLQKAYPEVVFVYMTGHAQHGGKKGYNRHLRNNQIRRWVKEHPEKKRVLFDFADLDSWWYNAATRTWEQSSYKYFNGKEYLNISIEHPRYHGQERAHTTLESCRQKGRASWWMFARLAGWNP